ncbi:unnamed protein product [Discosporangium mesarthrocarpum]
MLCGVSITVLYPLQYRNCAVRSPKHEALPARTKSVRLVSGHTSSFSTLPYPPAGSLPASRGVRQGLVLGCVYPGHCTRGLCLLVCRVTVFWAGFFRLVNVGLGLGSLC